MMNITKTLFLAVFALATTNYMHSQIFKTKTGGLEELSGVKRYNLVFEYSDNLKVPKYVSEEVFLTSYTEKKNARKAGSGDSFRNDWFTNRETLFEPKFIQEFNFFNLKEKQVTVAQNITDAAYTMTIKTSLIDPGNSNFIFKKNASIEVTISIFKSNSPHQILYQTEIVDVHSKGASTGDFDRIMSAYAELGRGLSKHLSRKTLN